MNSSPHNILGVSPDASIDDIKKAYRELARKHHPDKGGDPEKFKAINNAFKQLTNPEAEENFEGGPGPGGFPDFFGGGGFPFAQFFGPGGHGFPPTAFNLNQNSMKPQPVLREINVPLQLLYLGGEIKFDYLRDKICEKCDGVGYFKKTDCNVCNKTGRRNLMRMLRTPQGILQINETVPCDNCQGKGVQIDLTSKCETCDGNQTIKDTIKITVNIPTFSRVGDVIVIPESGNFAPPSKIAGDLALKLNIAYDEKTQNIRLDDKNIIINHDIDLVPALCGFTEVIQWWNNEKYTINTTIPIQHGQIFEFMNAGFGNTGDSLKSTHNRGKLIIKYNIIMPRNELTSDQKEILQKLF